VQHQRERILVVDDDPTCRALLHTIFVKYGFEVFTTDTVLGATALIATFRPTVILLDLALPYRSGASLLSDLKADPDTSSIPVVILSGLPDMLSRERRRQAAAVVSKPFRTRALVDTIRAVCARQPALRAPVRIDSANIQPQGSL
jgi:DNA-binding response OmpR family regulator